MIIHKIAESCINTVKKCKGTEEENLYNSYKENNFIKGGFYGRRLQRL